MRSSPGVELTAVRFINLIFFLVHPNIHVSGVGTGKGGRGKFSTANKNEARSFFAQAFFALEKTRSAGASSAVADDDADDVRSEHCEAVLEGNGRGEPLTTVVMELKAKARQKRPPRMAQIGCRLSMYSADECQGACRPRNAASSPTAALFLF